MLNRIKTVFLSVPVRLKIIGIMVLPVLILGLGLNYWVRTGLSDWLSYLLSNERVRIAMEAGSRSVLFVTVIAALISVLLTFLLMLQFTHPLLELRKVAHRVMEGDLESRARVYTRDEIGQVADAVNEMLDRLISGQQRLQRINEQLAAMNQVAMTTNRAVGLHDVLDAALRETLRVMNLQTGWIFLRDAGDSDDSTFRLTHQINLTDDFREALNDPLAGPCRCQEQVLGADLGQRAIVRKCYRLDISDRADGAPPEHITIPLVAREQRFGAINLLIDRKSPIQQNDLDLLSSIGAHLSEIVANAWLHERLVEKEAVRQTLFEALVRAEEGERANLARELHDGAGQQLTTLLVRLKRMEKQAQGEDTRTELARLCDTVSNAIEQVRGISHHLRPVALEELGLEVAVRSLTQEICDAAGIQAEFHFELNGQRLPFEIETTVYRIAQECLTNVIRHAGAEKVFVALERAPDSLIFQVQDDGTGFSAGQLEEASDTPRLGLLSMRERTEMQGGRFSIRSAPAEGTRVEVRIPVRWEDFG